MRIKSICLLVGAVSAVVIMAILLVSDTRDDKSEAVDLENYPASPDVVRLEALEDRLADLESRPRSTQAQTAVTGAADFERRQVARLQELEQRIQELNTARQASPVEDEPEPGAREGQAQQLSAEELRKQTLDDWYGRLEAHDREERDPAWAPRTSASFEQDLEALSRQGQFAYLNTDCRSTTCTATLGFDNYDQALSGFSNLLHHDYTVNCAREVLLPEPDDAEAPYVATVLYNCQQAR